jgi:hypothetical protein
MPRAPELVIGYDESNFPVEGICSSCGESMPNNDKLFASPREAVEWFVGQFRAHVTRWHLHEVPDKQVVQ